MFPKYICNIDFVTEEILNMHSVYGEKCLNEKTCKRWFAKLRSGNFSLKREDQTWCPVELDDELFVPSLEENPAVSVEKLAMALRSNYSNVHCHLQVPKGSYRF